VSGYYPTLAGRTESHCSDLSETRSISGTTMTLTENHCSRSTACITTNLNRLICWGNNGEGQMGIGAPSNRFEKRLPTLSFRSAGTSGTYYTNLVKPEVGTTALCALDVAGVIRCAGSTGSVTGSVSVRSHLDGKASKGIFGTGVSGDYDAVEKFNPVAVRMSGSPQPVFTDFSFNGYTGLAITSPAPSPSPSKQVYGWVFIPHPPPSSGPQSLYNATSELLTAESSNSDYVSTHWFGASWGRYSSTPKYNFFGINYGAYGASNRSGTYTPLISSALETACSSTASPLKGIVIKGQNSKFITSVSKPKMISKGTDTVMNLYSIQDDGLVKSIGQGGYGSLGDDSMPGFSAVCDASLKQVKK